MAIDPTNFTVKKSALSVQIGTITVAAIRFSDFKPSMVGRLLIDGRVCCLVQSGTSIDVHIPDPAWVGTPIDTVHKWIVIGSFSVDGEKRSMRPNKRADASSLKTIAVVAIEMAKAMEKQ